MQAQLPFTHLCPGAQALPQPPQLFGSELGSTQALWQQTLPWLGQLVNGVWPQMHAPERHISPCAVLQVVPQAPQLLGSNWVLVQLPLQVVTPTMLVLQMVPHVPVAQVAVSSGPAGQTWPQLLQF